MSLRAPSSLEDIRDAGRLFPIVRGFYDALVGLALDIAGLQPKYVNVSFSAATTDALVFHGLGHAVTAWEVVDIDASATVWRSATVNNTPNLFLILQASGICNVKLRVS